MLDPIIAFFRRVFDAIGYGLGLLIGWILWPFLAGWKWLRGRGWFVKIPVFAVLIGLVLGYAYRFYITQFWRGFEADYVAA